MGRAAAYDLLQQQDTEKVILADSNQKQLDEVTEFLCDKRLVPKIFDASNLTQVENIFKEVNAAVAAVHYKFNEGFTRVAIKTKTHLCDLGGNNSVVDKQLAMSNEAKSAGVSIALGLIFAFFKKSL